MVQVPADSNSLAVEFASNDFSAPERNRYAYQLVGFDPDWVSTDASKRFATYTNLDPGRYVFRVKAANKDGLWSSEPVSLEVTIAPPVWKTWRRWCMSRCRWIRG